MAATSTVTDESPAFEVSLPVFEGPFDLLLSLIAKRKLDVTEVALSQVTDDFIAHIKAIDWDLDETSEFLVVAATLLDLKAARLLPKGEVEDEEDLAMLEARDLLFARLLQYKAYKEVAEIFSERMHAETSYVPRSVSLEEQFTNILPDVVLDISPVELAQLAAFAMTPEPEPTVSLTHVHRPNVSVAAEAAAIVDRLQIAHVVTFRALTSDCPSRLHVVARFLALLELYRGRMVVFEQVEALSEVTIRWTGEDDETSVIASSEFDEPVLGPGESE